MNYLNLSSVQLRVIAVAAFYLVNNFLGFFSVVYTPVEYHKLMAYDGINYALLLNLPIFLTIIAATLLSLYLIYTNKKAGRELFFIITFFHIFLEFVSGYRVFHPIESGMGYIGILAWGALLSELLNKRTR